MANERIDIIISERGARTVQKSIKDVGKEADASGKAVDQLKAALQFAGVGLSFAALVTFVDTATEIRNILKGATTGAEEFQAALKGVQDIGTVTGTNVKSLAELYDTLATAGKAFKATQEDTLSITDTIAKAFAAEGKSAGEAGGAINALSRSLLKGETDMRGFISILNQSNFLAETLADQFGLTADEFVKAIEAGKVASEDLYKALLQSGPAVQAQFENTSRTIGQAFTSLQGGIITLVDNFEQATGFFNLLASAVMLLANNIEILVPLLAALATTWLLRVTNLVKGLQVAVVLLNLAWAANPIGVVIAALVALGVALLTAYQYWNTFREGVDRVLVALGWMSQATMDAHDAAFKEAEVVRRAAEEHNKLAFTGQSAAKSLDAVKRAADGSAVALDSYGNVIEQTVRKQVSWLDSVKAAVEGLGGSWSDLSGPSARAADAAVHFGDSVSNVNVGLNQGVASLGAYRSALDNVAEGYRQVKIAINEVNFANGKIGGGTTSATTGGGSFGGFGAFSLDSLRKDFEAGTLNANSPLFDNIYGPLGSFYAQNLAQILREAAAEKAAENAQLVSNQQGSISPTVSPQSVSNNTHVTAPITIVTPTPQAFGQSQDQIQRFIVGAMNKALAAR